MNNKIVLITGAGKRIGAAIAEHLHGCQMDIILHYHHSKDEADLLCSKLNNIRPDSATTVQADLMDNTACNKLIEDAVSFKSGLDVLINNASTFYSRRLQDTSLENWDELINVNLRAPFFLAKAAGRELIKNRGCIINIADIHGIKPLQEHTVYSTAKAGLIMLSKSLAKELAPDVRVNCIAPGAISWPEKMSEQEQQTILDQIPLKRRGKESDITNAVEYLINHADYMTGQTMVIDGGRVLK